MTDGEECPPPLTEVVLYQTGDRRTRIDVQLAEGTARLTQAQMAKLYQIAVHTVNEHLTIVYDEGELEQDRTIRNYRIVRSEGHRHVKLKSLPRSKAGKAE